MTRQKTLKEQLKSLKPDMIYSSANHFVSIKFWIEDVYSSARATEIRKWLLAAIKEKQRRDFSKPLISEELKAQLCRKRKGL